MRRVIPLVVCAKNEERMLDACLASLAAACAWAEARLPIDFHKLVVLDDTHDGSGDIAVARGFSVVRAQGGKVEAQRVGAAVAAEFHVFSDGDIVVAPDTLHAICRAMLASPSLRVACPPKMPAPPRATTLLSRAIHLYNLHGGYARARTWFSGKLFAVRGWHVPAGLAADDIWLSRAVVAEGGPDAIAHVDGGMVWFRAPETLGGMYSYFRRMQDGIAAVDARWPATRAVHRRWGRRRTDVGRLLRAPVDELLLHLYFRAAVLACRVMYRLDRAPPSWNAIAETKQPVFAPPA